jgi:hypothetical protein
MRLPTDGVSPGRREPGRSTWPSFYARSSPLPHAEQEAVGRLSSKVTASTFSGMWMTIVN